MKRGEVPGEGRSGGEGSGAITPLPFTPLTMSGFPGVACQDLRNSRGRGAELKECHLGRGARGGQIPGPRGRRGALESHRTFILVVDRRFPKNHYFRNLELDFTLC